MTPTMPASTFTITRAKVAAGAFTYSTYRLRGWINGRRVRKQFKSLEEAKAAKNRLEIEAVNSDREVRAAITRLSPEQLAEAEAANERLRVCGKPLSFAVDWFLAKWRETRTALPVSSLIEPFLADRRARGVESVTLRDYRQALARFSIAMGSRPLPDITAAHVLEYLTAGAGTRPKSWNNDRADLNAFFAWAMKPPRHWIDSNPVDAIEKRRVARGLPERLSAAQVAEVMRFAETYLGGEFAGYLALTFFAGLRPCLTTGETFKLLRHPRRDEWINFSSGYIIMAPEITKTNQQRHVKMEPNLVEWIRRYPPRIPPNAGHKLAALREKFAMGKDVTRHTYVSMHTAAFGSVGETALQAGNSEAMIKRHYLNTVTAEEARAFWAIVPSTAAACLPDPTAAVVADSNR